MACTVAQRGDVRRAAEQIGALRECEGTDVVPPANSQYNVWTVEATFASDGIPADATLHLGLIGLTLRDASPQGEFFELVATAPR